MLVRFALIFVIAMTATAQPQGWYPHEGGDLKYRVQIRFGKEPDSMPEGWEFGRVSAVATDSAGRVFVFHRNLKIDPLVVFDVVGAAGFVIDVDSRRGRDVSVQLDVDADGSGLCGRGGCRSD